MPAALLRSVYLPQLRHLLRHVPREFEPETLTARLNESAVAGEITAAERRELVDWLEDGVAQLAAEFSEIDVTLWPNFAHLAG